jgi:hypothetical protein
LNVWLRCGRKPNAAHIRRIVVWEKPVSTAIERIDQCVASTGSCAKSARSRQQPDRRLSFEVGRGEPHQADQRSDPSKIGDATCQRMFVDAELGSHLLAR